jgi:hypothetical protein
MPVSKLSDSFGASGSKKTYTSFLAGNAAQTPDAWDSISTTTLSTTQTTITFTIPQTYGHLRFHILAKTTDTVNSVVDNLTMNFNSDTGANYTRQFNVVDGKAASPSVGSSVSNTVAYCGTVPRSHTNLANQFGISIIDIFDYQLTTKFKTWKSFQSFDVNLSGPASLGQQGGAWANTNAITSVSFTAPNGNFAIGSVFALYGLKG